MESKNLLTAETLCRLGKEAFFHAGDDREKRKQGLQLLLEAQKQQHPEACYLVARLLLDGVLQLQNGDTERYAMELMYFAANRGWTQARAHLEMHCRKRYDRTAASASHAGPLVDFEGQPITVCRQGMRTPVDAVLTYENGKNVLTISTYVNFTYLEDLPDPAAFERAVLKGFQMWEGEYTVFGGQSVTVKVVLSTEKRLWDSLRVVPVTPLLSNAILQAGQWVGTEEKKRQMTDMMENQRSFLATAKKWSVHSRKTIFLQSSDGSFSNELELIHTAKHEFGHALGLGDLYQSATDDLDGVEPGSFWELDSYAVSQKLYHLVMCDSYGPVSNNDMEMVILAFRENKMQNYQPGPQAAGVSEALGKGN